MNAFFWVAIEGWAISLEEIGSLHSSVYVCVGIHELRCRSGSLYNTSVFVTRVYKQKLW